MAAPVTFARLHDGEKQLLADNQPQTEYNSLTEAPIRMRTAIDVEPNTPTTVLPFDPDREYSMVQNNSDTDMTFDTTGEGSSPLSASNGMVLKAGREICLTGEFARLSVVVFHAGETAKNVRVQGGRVR